MNGQQRTVLWIGLILVALNLVSRWGEIRSVIFNGAGIGAGIGTPGSSGSGGIGSLLPGAIGGALHDIVPGGVLLNTKKSNVQVM